MSFVSVRSKSWAEGGAGCRKSKEGTMPTFAELTKLYKADQEVLDIVTGMDIERVLMNEFKIQKDDFAPGEWSAMITRCAQRIRRQTMYPCLVKLVLDDLIESIGTSGNVETVAARNRWN
jgi:hypothetical protein